MLPTIRILFSRRLLSATLAVCLLFFAVLCIGAEAASIAFSAPENNAVPLSESSNYSDVTIVTPANISISAKKYFGSNTPSAYTNASTYDATLLRSSSYSYNCHGFAWYLGGTTSGLTDAKAFWIDSGAIDEYTDHSSCYRMVDLSDSTTCDQLVQASNRSLLRVGDIILYKNGDSATSNSLYSHSAVVTSISSSGVYVNSKWGKHGLYRHKVERCPYATTGYVNGTGTVGEYAKVVVYRPLHSNANNSILPTVSSSTYTLPSYVSIDDSTHKAVCSCGRGYTVKAHNFRQITTYRYECEDCSHIYDSSSSINSSGNGED